MPDNGQIAFLVFSAEENFTYWVEPRTFCWKYVLFSNYVKNISKHAAARDSNCKYTKGHICWATLPTVMTFVAKSSFLHRRLTLCAQTSSKCWTSRLILTLSICNFVMAFLAEISSFYLPVSAFKLQVPCALSDNFLQEYLHIFTILGPGLQ